MFKNFEFTPELLEKITENKAGHFFSRVGLFLLFILPLLIVLIWGAWWVYRDTTSSVFKAQENSALLAGEALGERLDHLTNVGTALATRVQFRELIEEGRWGEAVQIMENVPQDFPFVERVFLVDTEGILTADTPHRPGVVGRDFSFRDWYSGVSENWQPYVSKVYTRSAEPQLNVIAIAVPIKADSGDVLGALVLQMKLDTIAEWAKGLHIKDSGFVYFVDQGGFIAAHPDYPSQGELVDYSSVEPVKNIMAGQSGVGSFYNPIEQKQQISAYFPVNKYEWGAVTAREEKVAFLGRNRQLAVFMIVGVITTAFGAILVYLLIRLLHTINLQRVRQQLFLQSIGDGVFVVDTEGNIIYFNKAAEKLSGYSAKEAMGRPYREVLKFIKEDTKRETSAFIKKALKGKASTMENDTVLVRKDKTTLPVADSAAPIIDSKGNISGVVVVFRDETERKQVEEMREQMVSLTSHQLKTPITHIRLYLETIKQHKLPKKAQEDLDAIDDVASKMFEMVKNMLNLSKLERGDIEIQLGSVDCVKVIQEVIDGLSSSAKKRGVKLKFNKPKRKLKKVKANDIYLHEAFRNVITNAIKYAKASVDISVSEREDKVLFKCSDDGIGIPRGEQDKIFSKFFRATNARQKEVEGSGLGLNIVKVIVEKLGGRVWFESEEGNGTTFYIELPAAK